MKHTEENVILDELLQGCRNAKEKILIHLFKEDFYRVYRQGTKKGFNWNNKK